MSHAGDDLDIYLEIVDKRGDVDRVLGRLSCLITAIAAYDGAVALHMPARIMLRHRARIVRDSCRSTRE